MIGVGCAIACTAPSKPTTKPTIWLTPSPTIDPTALPLGDQKYVADAPRAGAIFTCDPRMFQMTGGPGPVAVGAWVDRSAGTYDVTQKVWVGGEVEFPDASFAIAVDGDRRTIRGNGLPVAESTGVYPVGPSDPAYRYDPNPNPITRQDIAFAIPAQPTLASTVSCTYKEVGITIDGVELQGPLNSTGNDELAYNIQDSCSGGSQPGGRYHRHSLGDCVPRIHERNALVGYALDGFGIFSPYDRDGNERTSADLDECHGTTSEIEWDGKRVTMYNYVLTRDYPYTVACFRGTPTRNAFPSLPGEPPQR